MKITPLNGEHRLLGAKMTEYGGWEMPLSYPSGQVEEHLFTRRHASVFDVSHMGRISVAGPEALDFLQHVLTNNAEALEPGYAQYSIMASPDGGAADDVYLYRFVEDSYLLVVNAANTPKDTALLESASRGFDVTLTDLTGDVSMISVQGPESRAILLALAGTDLLTEPFRNATGKITLCGEEMFIAKTGYTGEPVGYEIFPSSARAPQVWRSLIASGAQPAGLAARDTLRLEAGMPLYGHEYGYAPDGSVIPVLAFPLAKTAVSFSARKGDFIGREALNRQFEALSGIISGDFSSVADLPRVIRPLALTGQGVARDGDEVYLGDKLVGHVTSGTRAPYQVSEGEGLRSVFSGRTALRSVALALVDSDIPRTNETPVSVALRSGKRSEGYLVRAHLDVQAPPHARPIICGHKGPDMQEGFGGGGSLESQAAALIGEAISNHRWRQRLTLNLIPSEMTTSPAVRMLSGLDPSFRYAEHRKVRAFHDAEVFYYQGTGFIARVEEELNRQLSAFLGAREAESRALSGQMANTIAYSAMQGHFNRAAGRGEPRRLGYVLNNHISYGGHLSAQTMGALKDYVAVDPRTEKPALASLPALRDNPYKPDVEGAKELIDRYRPQLVILGKSMALYREPVAEISSFVKSRGLSTIVMYDMAHVLGLAGPHFQEPFAEGAGIVTASTHKTFFGPQRGLLACAWGEDDAEYDLWERVRSRAFPGATSNHHLGTMLGLLMAAYEMNAFKDEYQMAVLGNAKSFAASLAGEGLNVAGDPADGYTQTHQVLLDIGYARGAEAAALLEESGIIANYQATPRDEGFSASGAIRFGVAEMTRFGFGPAEFARTAALIAECLKKGVNVSEEVSRLRSGFLEMKYCFGGAEAERTLEALKENFL